MNSREHYERAEQLLAAGESLEKDNPDTYPYTSFDLVLVAAQVHATLALAAAHGAHLPALDEILPPARD